MIKQKITWIDYGFGFCNCTKDNRTIEINKNIIDFSPKLFNYVYEHELLHYNNDKGILYDYWIDFKDAFNFKKALLLLKFGMKNKKAFIGELPFYVLDNKLYVNYYSMTLFIIILFLILFYWLIIT